MDIYNMIELSKADIWEADIWEVSRTYFVMASNFKTVIDRCTCLKPFLSGFGVSATGCSFSLKTYTKVLF